MSNMRILIVTNNNMGYTIYVSKKRFGQHVNSRRNIAKMKAMKERKSILFSPGPHGKKGFSDNSGATEGVDR